MIKGVNMSQEIKNELNFDLNSLEESLMDFIESVPKTMKKPKLPPLNIKIESALFDPKDLDI